VSEEKSKVGVRKEFDGNAIKWASRIGIEDVAVAKTLYWCVLNIYKLMSESQLKYVEFEKALKDIKEMIGDKNDKIKSKKKK